MRFLCRACGAAFETPGNCPRCGSPDAAPAVPCAEPRDNVGEAPEGTPLCLRCRRELLDRAQAFFLSLSDAEAEQLDDWLEGDSVRDCRAWRAD